MNAIEAFRRLRAVGVSVLTTADAARLLRQSSFAASKTLARLGAAGLVTRVRHGVWVLDPDIDPRSLVEALVAPFPAYLSLQTALQLHGMIEQIPSVVYAVSLARTQRIATSKGVFSMHHVAPELFGGAVEMTGGLKVASPEKALFDLAYLSGRTRLFRRLPEIELPRGFRQQELRRWTTRIASRRARTLTENALGRLLEAARSSRGR